MYEATDLTTYALCADMIGSGKSGLSIGLLEEAAIDGIPAIPVDSKGDLGNLLLQFRDFDPASFPPLHQRGRGCPKRCSKETLAPETAQSRKEGCSHRIKVGTDTICWQRERSFPSTPRKVKGEGPYPF